MLSKHSIIFFLCLVPIFGLSHGLDRKTDQCTDTDRVDCRLSGEWSEVPCAKIQCPVDGMFEEVACKLEYEGRGYSASDIGTIYVLDSEACIVMNQASLIFPDKRRCYSRSNDSSQSK